MKFSVIGGGVTGCITALRLKDLGHEVFIYDKSNKLGGSLLDLDSDHGYWHRGCQYLSPEANWFKNYKHYFNDIVSIFDHKYFSFTNFDNNKILENDFAMPCIDRKFNHPKKILKTLKTTKDKFDFYENDIALFLETLVLRTGHSATDLDFRCAEALQLSALLFNDDYESMLKKKKNNSLIDSLCALPRKIFYKDNPTLKAALPKEGYNKFFSTLHNIMASKEININLKSGVTLRKDKKNNKIKPYLRNEEIQTDYVVWCCNPVKLVFISGLGRLDSPVSKFKHLHCFAYDLKIDNPIYFQCFDHTTSIYRIYFYPTSFGSKICIECFYSNQNETELLQEVKNITAPILNDFRIELWKSDVFYSYYLFSHDDFKKFSNLEKIALDNNIIPGGWEIFGRDNKIEKINNYL